jgi:SecD/SecF fusion protein
MTSRKRNLSIIALMLVLLAGAGWVIATKPTVLGLDLRGGVELVYEGRPTPQVPEVTPQAIDDAIETIRKRTDALGVSEPEIQRAGADQISIGLPDVDNADRAIAQVGTTAQLQFYDWEPNARFPGPDADFAGKDALYDAVEEASKAKPKADADDIPPEGVSDEIEERFGGDEKKIQEYYDRRNDSHEGRYYLFNDDKELIAGPDSNCEELLSDFEGVTNGEKRTAKDIPKGSECKEQLAKIPVGSAGPTSESSAAPKGGPPAGSEVLKVPRGIVVIETERAANQPDDVFRFFVIEDDSELNGADIKNPEQNFDQTTQEPIVTMEFTDAGRKAFARTTKRIADRGSEILVPPGGDRDQTLQRFAITLDDKIVSRATIDYRENPDGIDGRTGAQINGIGNIQDTQDLAESLRIGALPIELKLVSQTQVSASLGQQALDQGLLAGAVGLLLTLSFLIVFYRVLGMVAAITLIIYAIFLFALVKLIPITLTLPGIAGMILTLAVAADANIVIFERIKEEARGGASIPRAITTGYSKALRTIIDANVVTIGVAFILFTLATAGVKGFAFTLGVGTLVSLFTAVLATSAILGSMSRTRLIGSRFALGVGKDDKEGPRWHFDFIGRSKWFFSGSGVILVVSAFAIAISGLNFGIDFESGTRIKTPFAQQADVDQVREAIAPIGYEDAEIQEVEEPELGGTVFQISTPTLTSPEVSELRETLDEEFGVERADFSVNSIGPTFGAQIARTAVIAVIASLLLIALYMAMRFEAKFAVPVLIAVAHDILITGGVYALVGREVTTSTVAALLTILGYSLYDTIIVFDRIRENVPRMPRATFSQIVNRSMSEVLTRSLATSFSTLAPITALMFFGGETLQDFAFALLVGVASGAYSSIFIAAPVLTLWKEREPVYVRRRKTIMDEHGGTVPAFATGIIGDEGDVPLEGGDGGSGRPKRRRRTPVGSGAQPATAGGPSSSAATAIPPATSDSETNGRADDGPIDDGPDGDGNGVPDKVDGDAAARKARRAQNRARKRHGRR